MYLISVKKGEKNMKKTSIILALSMSVCVLTACGNGTISNETASSTINSSETTASGMNAAESSLNSSETVSNGSNSAGSAGASQNGAESTGSLKLYADYGYDIKEYTYNYSGSDKTPEVYAAALSELTGLDFIITATWYGTDLYVDWNSKSTLIAGLDNREQKQEFFFYDHASLSWFMMDSLWQTLLMNFDINDIYYTMNGGDALTPMDLYPISSIPTDSPYYRSTYYKETTDEAADGGADTARYSEEDYSGYWQYDNGIVLEIRDDRWYLYEEDGVTVSSSGPVEYDEEAAYLMNADGSSGGGKVYFDENNNLVDSGHILTHIS